MGTQFFSAVPQQKMGGPFGRRECGSPALCGGHCGFLVKAHRWRYPTRSSSCSAGCREGADAQDTLNLTSYHNLLVGGEGRATAPCHVQRHCPRKCILKDSLCPQRCGPSKGCSF